MRTYKCGSCRMVFDAPLGRVLPEFCDDCKPRPRTNAPAKVKLPSMTAREFQEFLDENNHIWNGLRWYRAIRPVWTAEDERLSRYRLVSFGIDSPRWRCEVTFSSDSHASPSEAFDDLLDRGNISISPIIHKKEGKK